LSRSTRTHVQIAGIRGRGSGAEELLTRPSQCSPASYAGARTGVGLSRRRWGAGSRASGAPSIRRSIELVPERPPPVTPEDGAHGLPEKLPTQTATCPPACSRPFRVAESPGRSRSLCLLGTASSRAERSPNAAFAGRRRTTWVTRYDASGEKDPPTGEGRAAPRHQNRPPPAPAAGQRQVGRGQLPQGHLAVPEDEAEPVVVLILG